MAPVITDWLLWLLLGLTGAGTLLMLLAAWGNLTLPNAIARMHASGLGSTLGILLLLLAAGLYFHRLGHENDTLLLMGVLGFFLFLTSPMATTAMTRAALKPPDSRERQFLGQDELTVHYTAHQPLPQETDSMEYIDRQGSDSSKWGLYAPDVIPLWVADMDFKSPQPILDALQARVEHGVFGYGGQSTRLAEVFCEHLDRTYAWQVSPGDIVFLPGLVCGLNAVTRSIGSPGSTVMSFEPVYPPFLGAPGNQNRHLQTVRLHYHEDRGLLQYYFDLDDCRRQANDSAALFLLCNPHNPVGRSFTREELLALAEFCQDRNIVLCSDEIHCDLLLGETRHIPVASLAPEIAQNTITLMAPSKTFNMPGLGCSMAIVQNPALRAALMQAMAGIVPHVNVLGFAAAAAAYGDPRCHAWVQELCRMLTANRDYLVTRIQEGFPAARLTRPESTYLGWIDFGAYVDNPYRFFHAQAKVALSPGDRYFTQGGHSFARINMGTSRAMLEQALDRMQEAVMS